MPSLRAHHVSFAFQDSVPLLSDVTFHLAPGWSGLIGPNGGGKSTLLRLLSKDLSPTEGHVQSDPPELAIAKCTQEAEQAGDDVLAFEEAYDRDAARLKGQLHLQEAPLSRWATLSAGERKRWQVGSALWRAPDVLLLDEPTNHLDREGRAWLLSALRTFRGVGLVVSHDRELLDALVEETLVLEDGQIRTFQGGYSKTQARLAEERSRAIAAKDAAREKEQKLAARLDAARREQQAATLNRSRSRRMKDKYDHDARTLLMDYKTARAEQRIGRQVTVLRREADKAHAQTQALRVGADPLGAPVTFAGGPAGRSLLFSFEVNLPTQTGQRTAQRDVARGTRLSIEGMNGAGKSTLLKRIFEGRRVPGDQVLYLPQETSAEEAAEWLERTRELPPDERGKVLVRVAALGVSPERLLRTPSPSPGEARKLVMAWGLGRQARAMLLDEPTNHLDLPSVERLEAALRSYEGALVLVSHDARFTRALASERWQLSGGLLITEETAEVAAPP